MVTVRQPRLLCAVLVITALVCLAPSASADGMDNSGGVQAAQTLGERELTVRIGAAPSPPALLRVDVITHAGDPGGQLTLRLKPTGVSADADPALPPVGTVTSQATLNLGAQPGSQGVALRVDRPGPWELGIDDGSNQGWIPFVIPKTTATPWDNATFGGFAAAGVLLLVALAVAVRARRSWVALIPGAGVVAALAVAVTAAILGSTLPGMPAPQRVLDPTGDTPGNAYTMQGMPAGSDVDYSRPPMNLLVRTDRLVAGSRTTLHMSIVDAATGMPVDDLLVHDSALIHLVVVGPGGQLFHLHPVRTGPGQYAVSLRLPQPGSYAVTAELARRGGGVSLLRAPQPLVVPGAPRKAPEFPGVGPRDVAGMRVDLAASQPLAGEPTTVSATVSDATGPVTDLQPWLGMPGHMIVVGPVAEHADLGDLAQRSGVFAHVHAMGATSMRRAPATVPDETVAAYGPQVEFTYTFPEPGSYLVWVQFERDYAVHTVPATVRVSPDGGGS